MKEFSESDWKALRELRPIALERLCQKIAHEVGLQLDWEGRPYHQRFLRADKLMQRGNERIARAFDDLRRSTAFMRLVAMVSEKLVTDDELLRFSAKTRSLLQTLTRQPTRNSSGSQDQAR